MSLLGVPDDIIIGILSLSEVGDLFTCKRVCRRLEGLIRSDVTLQYTIELAINGMMDGPLPPDHPESIPLIGRLERLRECNERLRTGAFHDSWFEYSWQRWPRIAEMPTDDWGTFLAFGSAISYVVVKPPQKEISICAPPILGGATGQLDSNMRSWRVPLELFPSEAIIGVSVDVGQDLLVVCQPVANSWDVSVHLRQLNKPADGHPHTGHPVLCAAPSEQLETPAGGERGTMISAIQIYGRLVAWLLHPEGHNRSIEIWDWQTGRALWRCQFDYEVSFTLLDASRVIVASAVSDVLLFYDITSPSILDDPVSARGRFELALTLPPTQSGGAHIQETCIPAPTSRRAPFWPDPRLSMAVVVLSSDCVLLIPHSNIYPLLAATRSSSSPSGTLDGQRKVPWESWGPRNTLQLHRRMAPSRWTYRHVYSYGSRLALFCFDESDLLDGADVAILDLNPWAVKHAKWYSPTGSQEADDRLGVLPPSAPDVDVLLHVAFEGGFASFGFAQSPPVLAMDHRGFTTMFARHVQTPRFLGSISYYT